MLQADGCGLRPKGIFKIQHKRADQTIGNYELPNGITNEGKNALVDIMFPGDTQVTTWFIGLIDNAGFTALAAADTHASHSGWAENTDYDESNRPTWTEGAAASQSMTNAATVDFTINATIVLKGIFLAKLNTKGSTASSILWSTGAFGATINAVDDDVLSITYTTSVA